MKDTPTLYKIVCQNTNVVPISKDKNVKMKKICLIIKKSVDKTIVNKIKQSQKTKR